MINLSTDLNILYFGGSGGFYFFHYVMLAGQHWCCFPGQTTEDFDTEFKQVFERQWAISNLKDWKRTETWPDNTRTVISGGTRPHKIYLTCNNIEQWLALPGQRILLYTDIQSQIRLSRAKKTQYASTRIKKLLEDSVEFCGHQVLKDIPQAAPSAAAAVYLQHLILRPEHTLGIQLTRRQQQFTQHWLSLHPDQLLRKIHL